MRPQPLLELEFEIFFFNLKQMTLWQIMEQNLHNELKPHIPKLFKRRKFSMRIIGVGSKLTFHKKKKSNFKYVVLIHKLQVSGFQLKSHFKKLGYTISGKPIICIFGINHENKGAHIQQQLRSLFVQITLEMFARRTSCISTKKKHIYT